MTAPTSIREVSQTVTVFAMVAREQNGRVLSHTEHRMVKYLAGHGGRFVAEWELNDYLYNGASADHAVRELVRRVRVKLGKRFIENDGSGGYRITAQRAADLERVCSRCGRPPVRYGDEWVCYGCPSTQHADLDVGRAGYEEGTNGGKRWSEEDKALAVSLAEVMTYEEIGELVNRSDSAVRGLFAQLGIEKKYVASARRKERK